MYVREFADGKKRLKVCRNVLPEDIPVRPLKIKTAKSFVKANHKITPKRAARIIKEGVSNEDGGDIKRVKIRTILYL